MVTNVINMNIAAAKNMDELVRMLAMLRLRTDQQAGAKGITDNSVVNFSNEELQALPEHLIVHIVDDYSTMKQNGVKDEQIFKSLDMQRSLQGHKSVTVNGKNLSHYIKQRVRIEFPQISAIDDKIIDMDILYSHYWFTKERRSRQEWQKANTFAAKVIQDIQQLHAKELEPVAIKQSAQAVMQTQKQTEVASVKSFRPVIWLFMIALISAAAYWLAFMDGMQLIKQLIAK